MLAQGVNNSFTESSSVHSLGLQNNMTVPSPGFDNNPLMVNTKKSWGATNRGFGGLFDSGLDLSQWGTIEWLVAAALLYGVVMILKDSQKTVGKIRRYRRKRAEE